MVTVRTIYRWRAQHRDFAEAVGVGKEMPTNASNDRSIPARSDAGFEAVQIFKHAGDDDLVYAAYRREPRRARAPRCNGCASASREMGHP